MGKVHEFTAVKFNQKGEKIMAYDKKTMVVTLTVEDLDKILDDKLQKYVGTAVPLASADKVAHNIIPGKFLPDGSPDFMTALGPMSKFLEGAGVAAPVRILDHDDDPSFYLPGTRTRAWMSVSDMNNRPPARFEDYGVWTKSEDGTEFFLPASKEMVAKLGNVGKSDVIFKHKAAK